MTLSLQEKIALSDVRMEKAREFLDDAVDNLGRGRYRTAVNRAYYAVMNALRSLDFGENKQMCEHFLRRRR